MTETKLKVEESSAPPPPGPPQIDLSSLPIDQLKFFRHQIRNEMGHYGRSLQQLGEIQSLYNSALNTLEKFSTESTEKEILAPLTESLYIPATLSSSDTVLTDIGTGYFVERTIPDAKEHINRRSSIVNERVDEVEKAIDRTKKNLAMIETLVQRREAESKSSIK